LSTAIYGSDVVVEMLRALEIPYVALNPGASFRGLHDSLVNFGRGAPPELILCCHEEIAVALAHGYAKATGRPMAAVTHNVVGLQHASMAIFNAWCDHIPLMVLGGTGPMNTQNRRPWIDWVHTALVQGNQVRDYVKWDDQPASVAAFPESLLRAYRIACTEPQGPVYVCFDADLQEERLTSPIPIPEARRFAPPRPPAADPEALDQAAALLVGAQWPVILTDATGRHPQALAPLQELGELLAAPLLEGGACFNIPNTHPLDLTFAREEALQNADVALALDTFDLQVALGAAVGRTRDVSTALRPEATVIHITLGDLLQKSWAVDAGRLQPVDIPIAADTALALPQLVALCKERLAHDPTSADRVAARRRRIHDLRQKTMKQTETWLRQGWDQQPISSARLYGELWELIKGQPYSLVNGPFAQTGRRIWQVTEPAHWLVGGRGGGLGYGPGGSLGAALAFKGTGRLCIDIQGDGDLLYTPSALWTAAHHRIPLLMIVFNNRSYYQDEGHQHHMAVTRDRPLENVGEGIHLRDPDTDFVSLARAFNVEGFGPVTDPTALRPILERAIRVVRSEGRPALVDVITQPR
jgi:thiamine pyrophosphate-dependent acetolactate synthase large subunit-like protein